MAEAEESLMGGHKSTPCCCGLCGPCSKLHNCFLESFEYRIKVKDRIKFKMEQTGKNWDEAWHACHEEWREHDQLNLQLDAFSAPKVLDPAAPKSIAFLFLTVAPWTREDIWTPWFEGARSDQYDIVAHNDKGGNMGELGKRARWVQPPTKTGWATSGLVRATILMLREALKNSANTHFILLSNADVPLFSFSETYKKVSALQMSRFNRFGLNWDESFGRHVWKSPGPDWHGCTKRGCNSKADQWCTFNREDAVFFAERNFLKSLRPCCLFVDEPYFINIMYQHERKFENRYLTYTDWVPFTSSPVVFDECLDAKTIEKARNEGAFFIRKVTKNAKLPKDYTQHILGTT